MSPKQLTHGSLFAGIGGFDLGFERAGIKTIWQVEIDEYCRRVLARHFPDSERFDDVRRVGRSNLSPVGIIAGGFPCQDVSLAGKQRGLAGRRSGLFWEAARIIAELLPPWIVIENVPGLFSTHRGRDFGRVINALDELGYCVAWRVLDARFFGVAQRRRRVFLVGSLGTTASIRVLFDGPDAAVAHRRTRSAHIRTPHFHTLPLRKESVKHGNLPVLIEPCTDSPACADSHGVRTSPGISRRLDVARYGSLGNAVCPRVSEWIGRRIVEAEQSAIEKGGAMDNQQLREQIDGLRETVTNAIKLGKPSIHISPERLSELLEAAERADRVDLLRLGAEAEVDGLDRQLKAAEAHRDRLAGALRKIVDSFYFLEDHIHQDCVICRPAYEHRHEEDCPILAAERLFAAEALKEAGNGE